MSNNQDSHNVPNESVAPSSKPMFQQVNLNQLQQTASSFKVDASPVEPKLAGGVDKSASSEVDLEATVMDPESVKNAIREFSKVSRELREKKLKNVYIEANTSEGSAIMNISPKETVITMKSPRHVFICNHATADCLYDGQVAKFGIIQKFQAISAEISSKAQSGQARTKMVRED